MGMDYNKLHPDDDREGAVKLLCFDLTKASEKTRFVWCSIGVFFFYIIYGYLQVIIIIFNQN